MPTCIEDFPDLDKYKGRVRLEVRVFVWTLGRDGLCGHGHWERGFGLGDCRRIIVFSEVSQ